MEDNSLLIATDSDDCICEAICEGNYTLPLDNSEVTCPADGVIYRRSY